MIMKKIILAVNILVLSLVSTQTFAQSLFDRIHFGVKAGANYCDFINADFNTEGLIGFHGGATVLLDISDRWVIQEDFLFSVQGTKLKNDLVEDDIEISYLNVPIVLQYHLKKGLFFEAGPQFNMLISDYDGLTTDDFAEKIDIGVTGGIGYHFNNNGELKGLGIGARYYMGLSKVSEYNFSNSDNADYKHGMAQISVFYIF